MSSSCRLVTNFSHAGPCARHRRANRLPSRCRGLMGEAPYPHLTSAAQCNPAQHHSPLSKRRPAEATWQWQRKWPVMITRVLQLQVLLPCTWKPLKWRQVILTCVQAGDELDELLQKLAGQYRGTHFCRLPIPSGGDTSFRHLAVERSAGEATCPW